MSFDDISDSGSYSSSGRQRYRPKRRGPSGSFWIVGLVFLVIALGGGYFAYSKLAKSGAVPGVDPLTDAERTAWKKFVRDHRGYLAAGYQSSQGWMWSGVTQWSKSIPIYPGTEGVSIIALRELPEAKKDAEAQASDSKVELTAVIDLTDPSGPKIVEWYFDDGKGVKRFSTAPKSERESSLNTFLLDTQKFRWGR